MIISHYHLSELSGAHFFRQPFSKQLISNKHFNVVEVKVSNLTYSKNYGNLFFWAQLFEGRLALTQGYILTRVSFFHRQKHFLGQFSLIFLDQPIIKLYTKRIKLNFLCKLSYLNSNFALTLGYLDPALNNPALDGFFPFLNVFIIKSLNMFIF